MGLLRKTAGNLAIVIESVFTFFFVAILIITILQVILRYLFNGSILGGHELLEVFFIYTTSLGAATAIKNKQHIRISFFVDLLPLTARWFVDILSYLCIISLNIVMIFYSVEWIAKVGDNESPVLRIQEWTFQLSIPIGCSLVILYCLLGLADTFMTYNNPDTGPNP